MESRKFKGKISSALIMGDLKLVQSIYAHLPHKAFDSADGGYISATKLKDAKLFESSKFSWLIPTGMKTMVATNFT
jgi:hypothetical protein